MKGMAVRLAARVMMGVAIAWVAAAAPVAGAWAAEKRVALVIRNVKYQDGPELAAAAANAAAMTVALRVAGFEVIVASDVDHRTLTSTMAEFQRRLATADLGFFYYSGLMMSIGGQSFVLPVDARLRYEFDVVFETVELEQILQQIRDASHKAVVVIDTMMPNPAVARLAASMGEAASTLKPAPAPPPEKPNLLTAYSHQPGTAPPPVAGRTSGPYATVLAKEIVKPGAELRAALKATAEAVAAQTGGAQQPWFTDRLPGDLVLVPAAPAPVAAATPSSTPAPAPAVAPPPPAEKPPAVAALPPPSPAPAPAEEPAAEPAESPPSVELLPVNETYVTTSGLRVRAGPSVKSAILGTLPRGRTVTATGRVRGSDWLHVADGDLVGFVYGGALAKPEPPAAEPPAKPAPADVAAAPRAPDPVAGRFAVGRVYTTVGPAVLLATPSNGAASVRSLERGAPVTVLATVENPTWVHVRDIFYNEGYVAARSLTPDGEAVPVARSDAARPEPARREPKAEPPREAAKPEPPKPEPPKSDQQVAMLPGVGIDTKDEPEETTGPAAGWPPHIRQAVAAAEDAVRRGGTGGSGAARRAFAAAERAQQAQARAQAAASGRRGGTGAAGGDVYQGEPFGQGLSGVGIYRFASGISYAGEWRSTQMHGHGVIRFSNGDWYEGEFRDGRPQGVGVFHFADGILYAGELTNGKVTGVGQMRFPNGDVYVGTLSDGRMNGSGRLAYGSGASFLGTFRNGLVDGPGVRTFDQGKDKLVIPGVWRGSTTVSN